MAITYFASASTPADPGTNLVTTVVVTPPASMVAGDLVLFWGCSKTLLPTFAISQAGGQTWNTISQTIAGGLSATAQLFWCRFNGTWSANPSIAITNGASAWSAVMHVFRPTTGTNTWDVDQAMVETDYVAPATPFTVTITGQTTTQANTITLATWLVPDDVLWITLAGTGWVVTGSAQYRNTSGSDLSLTFAHKIQTSAGATGNVSKNQSTNGPDDGTSGIITFYELAGTSNIAGLSAGTSTVAGNLVGTGTMAGLSAGTSTVAGVLRGAGTMAGTVAGTSTVAGAITGFFNIAGTVNGTSTVSGNLTGTGTLAGTVNGTSTVSGNLTGTGTLAGTVNGTSTVAGALVGFFDIAGTVAGTSTVSGNLTGAGTLTGTVNGISTVAGNLVGGADLAGTVNGTSTASGNLLGVGRLVGTANGMAVVTGNLEGQSSGNISGSVNGTATVTGNLIGTGTPAPTTGGVGGNADLRNRGKRGRLRRLNRSGRVNWIEENKKRLSEQELNLILNALMKVV